MLRWPCGAPLSLDTPLGYEEQGKGRRLGTLGIAHSFYHQPPHTHAQWPVDPGLLPVGKEQHGIMAGAAAESEHGRATVCHAPVTQGSPSTGNAQPPG